MAEPQKTTTTATNNWNMLTKIFANFLRFDPACDFDSVHHHDKSKSNNDFFRTVRVVENIVNVCEHVLHGHFGVLARVFMFIWLLPFLIASITVALSFAVALSSSSSLGMSMIIIADLVI